MTQTHSKVPKVSIVLPAYNMAPYLRETLDSILRQTFTDFECIVINDGSTDNSADILNEYDKRDPRMRVINQANQGLVKTLNSAIRQARGAYIARVDGDDPSFEDRLEKQVAVLDDRPGVVLVGGGFEIMDEHGYFLETVHIPTTDADLRRAMALRNPFGHAGVLFRKDAALEAGLYTGNHGPTEDYNLWMRLSQVGQLAALPQPVYRYRIVGNGISQSNSELQMRYTREHASTYWLEYPPQVLTRREIMARSKSYMRRGITAQYGIGIKRQFLFDTARIGAKLIAHGHPLQGIRQLINLTSTGRAGLAEVKKRVAILARLSR